MSLLVHTSEVPFENTAEGKRLKLVHKFLYIDTFNSSYFTTQASSQHEADHMNQAATNNVSHSDKLSKYQYRFRVEWHLIAVHSMTAKGLVV